jgi:hypothetical protein
VSDGLVYVVLAFAAYRMARAVALDDITLPFRERLYAFAWDDEEAEVVDGNYVPKARAPWRTWLWSLFTCPLCIGFWISCALYACWRWLDYEAVHVIIVMFAIAGAQCFLQQREE